MKDYLVLNNVSITNVTSAYIHIPFCHRRCYYCDFPISVVGNSPLSDTSPLVVDYVEALSQEIETIPVNSSSQPLKTVFFGGGTPSLLPVASLEKILTTLDDHLGIAADAEISLEIDPGTFNRHKLQGLLNAGVNRISLGIQAFQDELLKICGRSHSTQDIIAAIAIIQELGITNFSLDLISGLPHQTLAQWQDSLAAAIAIRPHHLSCYDLVLEPVTAFGKQYQPGNKPLPTDEDTAAMYRLAQQMLTDAGYEHYEVSNYAQPGFQCRHNRVYWENKSYYGFGMGAASFFDQKRFTRPRTRREYYAWVKSGAVIDAPTLSARDYLLETLMLGLRLAEGVSLTQIEQQFGRQVLQQVWICLQACDRYCWVELVNPQQQRVEFNWRNWQENSDLRFRLTDPDGFLFSNTVLTAIFDQFSE